MLTISSKSRYGIGALLALAEFYNSGLLQIKDIASRCDIPHHYLEHIFIGLGKSGIIENTRGKKGGYQLDTPVAVVEKATWEQEKIIRGTLSTIAEKVEEAAINKTAIICVGQVFSQTGHSPESKLYSKYFSHGTRSASHGKETNKK